MTGQRTTTKMVAEIITMEMQKEIKNKFCFKDKAQKIKISLGSSRLDFEKEYYVEKWCKKGIKVFWINGNTKVNHIIKVKWKEEYKDYMIYSENLQYIEHFNLKQLKGGNEKHEI